MITAQQFRDDLIAERREEGSPLDFVHIKIIKRHEFEIRFWWGVEGELDEPVQRWYCVTCTQGNSCACCVGDQTVWGVCPTVLDIAMFHGKSLFVGNDERGLHCACSAVLDSLSALTGHIMEQHALTDRKTS